jgi:hypothetical protein
VVHSHPLFVVRTGNQLISIGDQSTHGVGSVDVSFPVEELEDSVIVPSFRRPQEGRIRVILNEIKKERRQNVIKQSFHERSQKMRHS